MRSLYSQSLQSLPNWIQLYTSGTSAICTPVQLISNKNTFFCYSLLLGQFQLKLFYCGKSRQNFVSNITLYPCERSCQNHLEWIKYTKTSESLSLNNIQCEASSYNDVPLLQVRACTASYCKTISSYDGKLVLF